MLFPYPQPNASILLEFDAAVGDASISVGTVEVVETDVVGVVVLVVLCPLLPED